MPKIIFLGPHKVVEMQCMERERKKRAKVSVNNAWECHHMWVGLQPTVRLDLLKLVGLYVSNK